MISEMTCPCQITQHEFTLAAYVINHHQSQGAGDEGFYLSFSVCRIRLVITTTVFVS